MCKKLLQQVSVKLLIKLPSDLLHVFVPFVLICELSSVCLHGRSSVIGSCNVISPPAIAMPPAGLCFAYVTFFLKCRPLIRQWMDGSQRGLLR